MSENSDRVVSGKDLARCFKHMEASIGRSVIETIVYELEVMFRIILEGRFSYRLSEIDDALKKLLGDSAGALMMEQIVDLLDSSKQGHDREIL
ncbi:MAG: hypothetical protein AB1351_10045 [Thermoproteota archaeon]